MFASASETFSQRNIRCSIAESLERYRAVCSHAARSSVKVRGYVSCVAGCPYEGKVEPDAVVGVAEALINAGCYEISLGDTIGIGTATQIEKLLNAVMVRIQARNLAVHFHDTWGQALANLLIALQLGISVVDSSASGLGGCPYAPGATGNVATEDVVYMLNGMNIQDWCGSGWCCRSRQRNLLLPGPSLRIESWTGTGRQDAAIGWMER